MEDTNGEDSHEAGEKTGRRQWTPLQLENPEYLEALKNQKNSNRDFIMENIVSNKRLHQNKYKQNTTFEAKVLLTNSPREPL